MAERYLIKTDHGDVVVTVRDEAGGLDPELLSFAPATSGETEGIDMEVPLRAFAAKMIAIVERKAGDTPGGERMRRMLVQEKATADLGRIERWVRERSAED
jgi:hypothetical protein